MLVELAIGDAYGAGFESVRDRQFLNAYNRVTAYVRHPRHPLRPGCYTDDTQMSLAIAELIVSQAEWTPLEIASRFVDAFHRDPREGYAGGFFQFLKSTRTGAAFLAGIRPTSDKSGAAMRAAPIGVYPDVAEVIAKSTLQARVTHDTPDGIRAAVVVSLMAHFFLHKKGAKELLPDFLCAHVPGDWRRPWLGEVGSKGWMSVQAAITSLMRCDSLSALLKSSVMWGGDTDTVAAIALGVAACSSQWTADIPDVLRKKLEDGAYGRTHLQALDAALMKEKSRLLARSKTRR